MTRPLQWRPIICLGLALLFRVAPVAPQAPAKSEEGKGIRTSRGAVFPKAELERFWPGIREGWPGDQVIVKWVFEGTPLVEGALLFVARPLKEKGYGLRAFLGQRDGVVEGLWAIGVREGIQEQELNWEREDAWDTVMEEYVERPKAMCSYEPTITARFLAFFVPQLFGMNPDPLLLTQGEIEAASKEWVSPAEASELQEYAIQPHYVRYEFFDETECILVFRVWGWYEGTVDEYRAKLPIEDQYSVVQLLIDYDVASHTPAID
jgi:hypothetical protein